MDWTGIDLVIGDRIVTIVPEGKVAKNRVHLDFQMGGKEAREQTVERLLTLGATKLWDGNQGPHQWVTMADPEGNELCVSD